MNASPELLEALEQGNAALGRGDWETARDCFEKAIAIEPSAQAYEGLSWVHWSLNDPEGVFPAREAAFRMYHQAQDALGAARMAMWLAGDYVDFRGERSIANGWRQRARRLLEGVPLAEEHAWLLVLEGDCAMLVEEDAVRARPLAEEAVRLGRQLSLPDIEIMGLAIQGFSLLSEGDVAGGLQLLEESAASAVGGEMSHPAYVCWALCYLIYACERVRDYDRAMEWCDRMRAYAEHSQMASVRAICRVHLAGVMIWRGEWQAAEDELSDATANLGGHRPFLAADTTVRLAEVRHRQGRLQESEALFREVEWHPMALLGLAELALEAGRPKDAEEFIERFLRHVPDSSRTQRVEAFELMARTQALLGDQARAGEAMESVRSLSEAVTTLPFRAAAGFSAGALAIAKGDYEAARDCFEDAASLYERAGAPYETARARLELASVLVMLGRLDRARSETLAAHAMLKQLSSAFYAGRAAALLADIDRRLSGVGDADVLLTQRQIEILRLISQGRNDREIAASLVVSEHTVHRHVANILQRLDVPSRAAAVAYAGANNLI